MSNFHKIKKKEEYEIPKPIKRLVPESDLVRFLKTGCINPIYLRRLARYQLMISQSNKGRKSNTYKRIKKISYKNTLEHLNQIF